MNQDTPARAAMPGWMVVIALILFLAVVAITIWAWRASAKRYRAQGKSALISHVMGLITSTAAFFSSAFATFAILMMLEAEFGGGLTAFILSGFFAVPVWFLTRPANTKNIERREDYIAEVKAHETEKPRRGKERIETAPTRSSRGFITIEFDYVDREGNETHRTVDVWAVDGEYFEGWCHRAQDERTFVTLRIRGKLYVTGTKEVLTASEWAQNARIHPMNGRIDRSKFFENETPAHQEQIYKPAATSILFTGFKKADRERLEDYAASIGLLVRKTVTKELNFLCIGSNAGHAKMDRAFEVGATVLTEEQFLRLIETGELPS